MKKNVLKIENLSYSYQNSDRTQKVLDDINVEFEAGKIYAIIGESGSGKTTFLSLISALDKLQDGDIKYNDKSLKEITGQEFRLRYVNIVFQSYNLIKYMTAAENVEVASDFDNRKADPNQYLEKVGITAEEGKRLVNKLSGGQQQRVAIARALAMKPDILCFDEPTSALDPELTGEVLRVIRGLADQKTTMVIVTHEMAFARDVADTVIFMDGGVIVEQGDAKQVIEHPTQERTKQFLQRFAEN